MNKDREISGLLLSAQQACVALDLINFKNEDLRNEAKEIVLKRMYRAYSSHDSQTFGNNTVSVEDCMAYIHLGVWQPSVVQKLSLRLIDQGIAHTITWNDGLTKTQGGLHYRFNNLGDLTCLKTTQKNLCLIDGTELLKFSQQHSAEEIHSHIADLVAKDSVPSWENQKSNGAVYCAKFRKTIEQKSKSEWQIINQQHLHQFGLNPKYIFEKNLLNAISPNDNVKISIKGADTVDVKLNVLNVDADGIIEAELKSASWESDEHSLGDRFYLTKSEILEVNFS